MKKNMGLADRLIRTAIAFVVGLLIINGTITGALAWVLGILSVVFLATSLVSTCPLYTPLGISTRKSSAADPEK